jgi:hypothetical protein
MALLPTVDLAQRDTIRLISTGRLKDPVLLPLAGTPRTLDELAELEGVTSLRLRGQETGLTDLDPRELVFGRPGYTFINAAFLYTRPGGNRFNGEERGAWYCAFTAETSLAEVSYHLTRELEAVGRFDNTTDYAELIADFIGPFHDLRWANPAIEPSLHADPTIAYPAGQALARLLRRETASNGMVYRSIRHDGGICLAAFRPDLVQNLRQGGIWRLVWEGGPVPVITAIGAAQPPESARPPA